MIHDRGDMEEEYFTIDDITKRLKVTRKAVYDWMRAGELGYVQVGQRRRIPASALRAFIRKGKPEELKEENTADE